jgi:uncharacterized protein (DUF2062 family)
MLRQLIEPIIRLLKQGLTPEKLALTVALGVVLGVTPVIGSTTVLCTLAAILLQLNLPAIQLVNGLVYPFQFVLLIPFYRAGAWLFRADAPSISLGGIMELAKGGLWTTVQGLRVLTMHALVVWLIAGTLVASLLYRVMVPLMNRFWHRAA